MLFQSYLVLKVHVETLGPVGIWPRLGIHHLAQHPILDGPLTLADKQEFAWTCTTEKTGSRVPTVAEAKLKMGSIH